MLNILCPGYIGVAQVGAQIIRCSDFSVNPSQTVLFYDHTIGLNDTVPADSKTKGEEIGFRQIQKRIARPSPISIQGGFSFPATSLSGGNNFQFLFNNAKFGNYFNLFFQYHRGGGQNGRTFSNCRVNQFSFSIVAGDILNIKVEIFAKDMSEFGSVASYVEAEKLITWDMVDVTSSDVFTASGIAGIDFTINNNLKNIYTNFGTSFLPTDIRIGMQEVSGSVSVYNLPGNTFISSGTLSTTIGVSAPGFNTQLNVMLFPQQAAGSIGAVITKVPFVGVDYALGE